MTTTVRETPAPAPATGLHRTGTWNPRHYHGANLTVGYLVVRTQQIPPATPDDRWTVTHTVEHEVEGGGKYTHALALACQIRDTVPSGQWGIVAPVYACGCDEARTNDPR